MKIGITLPAYNEEKTLGKVIQGINHTLKNTSYNYKILVVDDGSTDNTPKIAKKEGAIVHSHPRNYGLAETFKTEIKQCLSFGFDIIIHIDADMQYMPKDIPRLIKEIEKGNDLVLGSRFKGKIQYMPMLNKFGNMAFSKVISNVTKVKITDAQTGFRAFTKEVAKNINIISTFTYTQEQIIRAARNKYKIKEIPIDTFRTRKSKLMKHPFDFAIKAWINIFRIYRDYDPLKFFGRIGAIIFLPGFIIGLYFIYLHFTSGISGHMGLFFLMLMLIFTSFQIIIFGFLADMKRGG